MTARRPVAATLAVCSRSGPEQPRPNEETECKFSDRDAISSFSGEYRVTQQGARPLNGEHLDNKEPGIYVDVVSGEPLFASSDKFDWARAGRASPAHRPCE